MKCVSICVKILFVVAINFLLFLQDSPMTTFNFGLRSLGASGVPTEDGTCLNTPPSDPSSGISVSGQTVTAKIKKPGQGVPYCFYLVNNAHFSFTFQTTNGVDILPEHNPVFHAYRAYRWEIQLTWSYNDATKVYSITLEDGAEYPSGYIFIYDADLPNTNQTQYPNLYRTTSWFYAERLHKSDDVIPLELYWGAFEFMLESDCSGVIPTPTYAHIYNSAGQFVSSDYTVSHNPMRIFLPWKAEIDPNGYWVEYNSNFSLKTQYPKKWKNADMRDPSDLIPVGNYEDSVPYVKIMYFSQEMDQDTVLISCPGTGSCEILTGGTWIRNVCGVDQTSDYHDCCDFHHRVFRLNQGEDAGPLYRYLWVKCSVPYRVTYEPYYNIDTERYEIGTYPWQHDGGCDQLANATARIETDTGKEIVITNHGTPVPGYIQEDFDNPCTEEHHHTATRFRVDENNNTFVFSHARVGEISFSIPGYSGIISGVSSW